MEFQRSSGILLHVSSLPSYGGIGDLGPAAFDFVNFLADAGQHVWQVLPLCPTGYGNSPYAGTSAFAGNPLLISLEFLSDWGWIDGARIAGLPGRGGNVDFEEVERRKLPLLYEAAGNFLDRAPKEPLMANQWRLFEEFCRIESSWLNDYAMYTELRRQYKTGAWLEWPEPLMKRSTKALSMIGTRFGRSLATEQVLQFAFSVQWNHLKQAANSKGIRILGDIAIFVALDSADVWTHPGIFELGEDMKPERVAGVPPDYFSATGQRWGNPLYRWETLSIRDFDWWVERMRRARKLYDIIRLDHFRGFESYWAIPASEETAMNGTWVPAPGRELFAALHQQLGELPHNRRVGACGIVTVRQQPQTANGTIFVTLEDETGPVNVIVWKHVRERQREALLHSRLMAVRGVWQRDVDSGGEVRHLIAERLEDLTPLLGRLGGAGSSRDFH